MRSSTITSLCLPITKLSQTAKLFTYDQGDINPDFFIKKTGKENLNFIPFYYQICKGFFIIIFSTAKGAATLISIV